MIDKLQDGSVSHIGSLLLSGSDEGAWPLVRLWLIGALLVPSVEFTVYFVSPNAHLFWIIVGGAICLIFAGLIGSLGGMKLSLFIFVFIHSIFRCTEGRAWDAAFIIVFLTSRIAGVWLLLKKFSVPAA